MSSWSLRYESYEPASERFRETLCTVGNGYFATRGAAPESRADETHYPGTYIAGCYNRLVSHVAKHRIESESLVNAPNWLPLTFRIGPGGDWFDLQRTELLDYVQELDMRKGILTRDVRFRDAGGGTTRLTQRRFVHMEFPHLAGLETTLVAEDWSGRVDFLSALDGRVTNSGVARYRKLKEKHLIPEGACVDNEDDRVSLISVRTSQSSIRITEAARTTVKLEGLEVRPRMRPLVRSDYTGQEFSVDLGKGESVSVEKIVAICTSRDRAISDCAHASNRAVSTAGTFAELVERQALSWNHLWRRFRIDVEGDGRAALAVNTHNFHLLQTVSPNSIDLDVGVPARGLHGEAYRGHILWDELFIFPLLNIHIPDLTRSLLMYRYRRLPEARLAAAKVGYKGALFPWQSGSDGREESQTTHLNPISNRWIPDNTHLQWHVNAAIAFNVWSYFQVTQDQDFLAFYGAEMMMEVARFLGSVAWYNKSTGRYEIRGVMGPDEYHDSYPGSSRPGLNNNAYTNVMAVWVMCRALETLEHLPRGRRLELCEEMNLGASELSRWEDISRKMFVPFHEDGLIISQFEGYDRLKEFDWSGYVKKYKSIQRLDRILEAEGDSTNNYKVSKQADVLMLFYLLSDDELIELFARLGYDLDTGMIKENVDYYLKRTTHGSTLSRVAHAWVLARMSREKSWQLTKEALESDLSDIQGGTTAEGIHLGAMAGTVEIIQRAYTGLVTRSGVLWLEPCLPEHVKSLGFTIYYGGHTLDLSISPKTLEISSEPGPASTVNVGFGGNVFPVGPGERRTFELRAARDGTGKKKRGTDRSRQ